MTPNPSAVILKPTPENLERVTKHLLSGGIAAMPTETVYGLAGNAKDAGALAKIFNAKERPTFDPLIVHVQFGNKSVAKLEALGLVNASKVSAKSRELADKLLSSFWPGPFTLVLPKHESVPDLATSGLPTVAIRMPKHPVAQALLAKAGVPLAAPSANRFGRISPTSAPDVLAELGERIEFILDGGPCEVGLESTVLSMSEDGALTLLRPGGVSASEIVEVSGAKVHVADKNAAVQAPGMLESHYAPEKRLCVLPDALLNLSGDAASKALPSSSSGKIGVLFFSGDATDNLRELQERHGEAWDPKHFEARSLTLKGNLEEAARNLFAELRYLDSVATAGHILAEPCPVQTGLGHAISDRLRRAGQKD